ncbi:MAG: dephospho-CoA kinase [Aquiluna sp.]|nr:dephospho-CoA kinase [Aquiluna sp.]MCF8545049.1 dephospho-CoA kinase [Aquiluna sp.]
MALTGGIGSGKSTIAKRWVELGATEIDADQLAREVVEPGTEGLRQVVKHFGSEVLESNGHLDRQALAKKAFASPESRKLLESILHPLIQDLANKRTQELSGVVIYTIPLFVETQSPLKFDKVVAVSCPETVRIRRLVENRGMQEAEARARVAAQATDQERELVADIVMNSDCSLEELIARSEEVFQGFVA